MKTKSRFLRGAIFAVAVRAAVTLVATAPALGAPPSFDNPVWSPDGRHVAMSGQDGQGVYVLELDTGDCLRITDAPSSGYAVNFSPDGQRLGFKLLIPQTGRAFPLQQPIVFEIGERLLTPLCEPVARAGVPSFAADGTLAYTVDRRLRILRPSGQTATYTLDHYANLTPISPDGKKVAFNNADEAICILDLGTGKITALTPPGVSCFGPRWSPDSVRLAVSTIAGTLMSVDVARGQICELDRGTSPSWMPDSRTIVYANAVRRDGVQLIESDVLSIGHDGGNKRRLTTRAGGLETSVRVSSDGTHLAYLDLSDARIYRARIARSPVTEAGMDLSAASSAGDSLTLEAVEPLVPEQAMILDPAIASVVEPDAPVQTTSEPLEIISSAPPGQVRLSRPCPYVHQVYDTANSFNGHWACGASSAIMAIQYYEILPSWPITCSWPYSHVSPFGQYVSAIYTYNGYTYNIGSPDPNGNLGYGGYGYIVRNNWKDTKGYMRDYFIRHGLGSSVDWSPTWAELRAEVNADHPFVLLNSLTSSGHYITTIGYYENQHTAVFNDPYGNKNTPGYPSYDGTAVYYDWPGYNNGFQNLKTVHCFIYARGGSAPTIAYHPQDRTTGRGATVSFSVAAEGLAPISYQWQKNGVNLTAGGRYSGVTDATLIITNVEPTDAAYYRCRVSNTYGSVYSESAQLRVSSADFDGDNDVDVEDFGYFQNCLGQTGVLAPPGCESADLDGDGDVDPSDLARFRSCFSGPGMLPPAGCL